MNLEPVALEGSSIDLVLLTLDMAPRLFANAEPELFEHTLEWPREWTLAGFRQWLDKSLAMPESLLYAVRYKESGEPIGTTGYLDVRREHRGLEIGRTWIARRFQGTRVNPESKYLLLRHAFETVGAQRVQFKTDANNLQSQRAIEKLGAVREGVLRKYQMRTNGTLRDTVIYSLVAPEWPEVKGRLEQRLGGFGLNGE
jgi:ribosomal-protein-alanine N-acetyltransferase